MLRSINLFNINSPYNVRAETLRFALAHAGFLYDLGRSIPVYLVDKDLMDTICPPQIRRLLEPGSVQDLMRSFDEGHGIHSGPESKGRDFHEWLDTPENLAALADKFWRSIGLCARGSTAVSFRAAYFPSLSSQEIEEIEHRVRIRIPFNVNLGENHSGRHITLDGVPTMGDMAGYQRMFGHLARISSDSIIGNIQNIIDRHRQAVPRDEAIFICMERIVRAARRIKEIWEFRSIEMDALIEIIFTANLLHQLAHAYMKTESARYYTPWGRVMEEGLVAAYTMSCFDDERNRAVIKAHLSRQPLEYKGFSYFESFSRRDLNRLLRAWSRNNVRKGLELSLGRDIPHLTSPLYERVFRQHSSFFYNQPEKFWQTLTMEILHEAAGK